VGSSRAPNWSGDTASSFGHLDISKPKTRSISEVQVDAKTGTVVSETTETPKQQQAEAIKEKGEHK
jgi:hypothetical protein